MIIFDLDGTLADCEHRRHFVDPSKNPHVKHGIPGGFKPGVNILRDYDERTGEIWKPDYQAFYEACDKDQPIYPVIDQAIYWINRSQDSDVQIWSGRSESVYQKTFDWLVKQGLRGFSRLRMRPIGNTDPDDDLKEMWLNDAKILDGKNIQFIFDDRPKVIRMFRRHGIFVFNCCQHEGEF